jgi:diguanylate cyclase (GGDEF)-like protein
MGARVSYQKSEIESEALLHQEDIDNAWMRRRQMKAYFDLLPASVMGNLLNAVLVASLYFSSFSVVGFIVTFVVAIGLAGTRLIGWRRYRTRGTTQKQRDNFVKTVTLHAGANGIIWGGTLLALMLSGERADLGFLGMVAAGMMCAGAISFSFVPTAARFFIGIVLACILGAFLSYGEQMGYTAAALLSCYTVVLFKAVDLGFSNFVARLKREVELRQSAETVRMLLHDFQEHGSDWLWEVDTNGKIIVPTNRFAEAAMRPLETLEGMDLLALFDPSAELKSLRNHINHVRSFRDLALEITINGEKRWWSLSAYPVRGDEGGLKHLRGVATDISAVKLAETKVAYLAHYDGLTDLPNRFLFNETINHALNRRQKSHRVAVLSIDLDHFKSVNDTLGHPAGDALLKIVSRRIETCIGEHEMVARMGGDEFAVLLPVVNDDVHAQDVAAKIIAAFVDPFDVAGQQMLCGASIGIAFAPEDGDSVETLMKHVDLALYDAKGNGRNRYSMFEADMDEAARARREIEIDLRAAMQRDELSLYYQPLVCIETGEPNSYEALLRWHHPTRGLVMPNDFIPIAEETGLILQLGEWVLRNAIAELAKWPEHLCVSVNLSPLQMKSASLISTIVNALAQNQVAPHRLELEITESVLMYESEVNLATLHKLKSLGIQIALDDFGTGYSSLNYLRSFPFDKIKIDRCFVQDVEHREDCQAIIRAITSLASSLNMVTTAEGVEDEAQRAQLKLQGCTEVQGYLFSKAVPAHELTNLRTFAQVARRPETITFLPPAAVAMTKQSGRALRKSA